MWRVADEAIGTVNAPGQAAEESLECVVVEESDRPLLSLLVASAAVP